MNLLRTSRTILFSALAVSFLAGCDDDNLGKVDGMISVDPLVVDFGDVLIGRTEKRLVTLKNEGNGSIRVTDIKGADNIETNQYEFAVLTRNFSIGPQETFQAELTFQALAATSSVVESSFTVETDRPLADGTGVLKVTIAVRGRGVAEALAIEPMPVDFGTIIAGTSIERDFMVTNRLSSPVDLFIRMGNDGKPEINQTDGNGWFEVLTPNQVNGSLLANPGDKIAANGSVMVRARYNANPSPSEPVDRGNIRLGACADDFCFQRVDFVGRATRTGIACMPPQLAFGLINPGRVSTKTITCMNVASSPLVLRGWELGPGTAAELTIVAYAGTPSALAPGESFTIDASFSPTQATLGLGPRRGEVVIRAATEASIDLDNVRIPLEGEAGGPGISVAPLTLPFGMVAIGTTHTKRLLIENVGYSPLTISSLISTDPTYATSAGPMLLDVGTSTIVAVTFTPAVAGPVAATLSIASDDALTPVVDVALSGAGVALPPCAYTITPPILTYGIVNQQETGIQTVRITNIGSNDCLLNDLEIVPAASDYKLSNGNETGLMLGASAYKDVPIEFTPTREGLQEAYFTMYISSASDPNPRVYLYGEGQAPCGNGIVNSPPEECDDGNPFNGDGCDNNCTFSICGNGQLAPGEQCDDGNSIPFDGCENDCTRTGVCGNFSLEPGEDCDDGNQLPLDGCSPLCTFEDCGNGTLDANEECDDGNRVGGDGCSAVCLLDQIDAADMLSFGVGGMRGLGTGTMVVSGVTGPIGRALLYWNGPTNSNDFQANAVVGFGGQYVTGTNIGFSSDNCWGFQNSQAYRADVTSVVTGDGNYALTDFVKSGVDVNGVSLVIFYDDGDSNNNHDITLFDSNDSNIGSQYDAADWDQSYPIANLLPGQTAYLEMHVSDGQTFNDGEIFINAATLVPFGMIFSGDTVPNSNGNPTDGLWDIRRWDMTPLLTVGPQTAHLTSSTTEDCLSLVASMLIIDSP